MVRDTELWSSSLFGDDYKNHVGQGLLTLYNVTMSNLKQYEQ